MTEDGSGFTTPARSWTKKFADAFLGIAHGVSGQSSFVVHVCFTAVVIAVAAWLRVDRLEWSLLLLSITVVLAAEMFNSALETISRAMDAKYNAHLERGLNIASAAVLVTAIGAALIGAVVLGYRIGARLEWWQVTP